MHENRTKIFRLFLKITIRRDELYFKKHRMFERPNETFVVVRGLPATRYKPYGAYGVLVFVTEHRYSFLHIYYYPTTLLFFQRCYFLFQKR